MCAEGRLGTIADLHELSERCRKGAWAFRGVSHSSYELLPKVGRGPRNRRVERWMYGQFAREAAAYVNTTDLSIWDLLALAQHHGLPTRLLDWTENPLVAAYFACRSRYEEDGAVFALKTPRVVRYHETPNPFEANVVMRYRPRHVTARIRAQRGLFTVHPDPFEALCLSDRGPVKIHKYTVPAACKESLRWSLSRFGFNESSMFPGLDGLARHVDWSISNADPSAGPLAV